MRVSRLLAGQKAFFRLVENPVKGLPPLVRPLSATQIKMNIERARIAALPADTSSPSRQTRRTAERAQAKRFRTNLRKMAGGKRSLVPADWRSHLTA